MSTGTSERRPTLTVTLNAAVDTTLTIDHLVAGESYTVQEVLKLPGGKGVNVARTLRSLGIPVWATGLAGGPSAAFVLDGLVAEGIEPHFSSISGATRICTAVVERESHRATEFNEPGPTVLYDEFQRFERTFKRLLRRVELVAICGSLPAGLPDDCYTRLVGLAHAAGVPSLVDTSGRAFAPALEARPLLVKPNAREAGAFVGRPVATPDDALQAGRQLRAAGAEMALITLGAAGAVFAHERGAWFVQAERVERPLSTVGCGDAFNGGLLAELYEAVAGGAAPNIVAAAQDEAVLMRGLSLGAACAAANTLLLGAGRMDQADVQRFRQTVTIQRLG